MVLGLLHFVTQLAEVRRHPAPSLDPTEGVKLVPSKLPQSYPHLWDNKSPYALRQIVLLIPSPTVSKMFLWLLLSPSPFQITIPFLPISTHNRTLFFMARMPLHLVESPCLAWISSSPLALMYLLFIQLDQVEPSCHGFVTRLIATASSIVCKSRTPSPPAATDCLISSEVAHNYSLSVFLFLPYTTEMLITRPPLLTDLAWIHCDVVIPTVPYQTVGFHPSQIESPVPSSICSKFDLVSHSSRIFSLISICLPCLILV